MLLLLGIVFLGLGLLKGNLLALVVGVSAAAAGGAGYVSKSPKIKLLEGIAWMLMAVMFGLFAAQMDYNVTSLFFNPLAHTVFAVVALALGVNEFREYANPPEEAGDKATEQKNGGARQGSDNPNS